MAGYLTLATTVDATRPYFRITSARFRTGKMADHYKVVNGQGAVNSSTGARYNHPGVVTVYLTEDLETCFAERMYYFHREVLTTMDVSHHLPSPLSFQKHMVLWEVKFKSPIDDVFDMSYGNVANASYFNIFPSLLLNPSQDYEHLKTKR